MAPIDHLLFFKVKPGTPAAATEAFLSSLRALASLESVRELYVGAAVRESPHGWTHALYGRYASRDALTAYMESDEHQHAVKTFVRPILDDVVCLDWEGEEGGAARLGAAHAVVLSLKPGVGEERARAMVDGLRSLEGREGGVPGLLRVSVGKNFTPGRDKGFTWGFIAGLRGEADLDVYAKNADHVAAMKEVVWPIVGEHMALDFETGPELPPRL